MSAPADVAAAIPSALMRSRPGLPARAVVLVNCDFESRSAELARPEPRGFEADAAVLDTARAVRDAFARLGVECEELRVRSSLTGLGGELARRGVDTVFNLVESIDNDYGREWQVPALLARCGVAYTGNGPRPLRLCRAKDRARRILTRAGVRVARGLALREAGAPSARLADVPFPCFVKPARVDGSIGIDGESLCPDPAALHARLERLARHLPGPFLVEEYLPGKEINVALFPEPARGHVVATEIDFSPLAPELPRFVTYDSKWNPASPEYASRSQPAVLEPALAAEVEALARRAFAALGGSAYGRVDMRLDAAGQPCVIDVNPNNDLHPDAGLALAARSVGIGYDELIREIVLHALASELMSKPAPALAREMMRRSVEVRQITSEDRAPLARLLARIAQFKPGEVEVALELVDLALRDGAASGYECLVALQGELCGYICFGPTPMTAATWDLYWIAVAPEAQGRGIGRQLFAAFVAHMRTEGGRQIRIETSSQESYAATGGFYERLGFRLEARLRDFYAPDDDLLIFYRQLA